MLLLTSGDLPIKEVPGVSNGNTELLIAELPLIDTSVLIMYTPSGVNFAKVKFVQAMKRVNEYLAAKLLESPKQRFLLMGDFNFPPEIVSWVKTDHGVVPHPVEGDSPRHQCFQVLTDITDTHGLDQVVHEPTRMRNVLDLIYTNVPQSMGECNVSNVRPLSDHNLVSTTFTVTENRRDTEDAPNPLARAERINFKAIDEEAFSAELAKTNWARVFDVDDGKVAAAFVTAVCDAATKVNAPLFTGPRVSPSKIILDQWLALREKLQSQNAHPSVTNTTKEVNNEKISELNSNIAKRLRRDKEAEEARVVKSFQQNSSHFYRYANKFKKSRDGVGPLKSGTTYESGPRKMAEILSQQYLGAFSTPLQDLSHINLRKHPTTLLTDIVITEEGLVSAMKSIKSSSSPGPDGLPAYLYNTFAKALARPLLLIWRRSLDTGRMPEGNLLAFICPIFKGGDKTDPANYRPIALTNHMVKIFERVVRQELVQHLDANGFTNRSQHAYKVGHSTITQLLSHLDSVLNILESGDSVDVIYLDLAKAFDKVDHGVLISKLFQLGVRGKVLTWITGFLKHRKQQVRVDGRLSSPQWVVSGVP